MKKILLVVDMQNGFARYPQTIALRDRIRDLLERRLFDSVIATRFLNSDDSIYEKLFDWHRLKTPEDQQLAPELAPYVDLVISKSVYTCVNADFLQRLCQCNGGTYPEEIYLVGADTDCCILTIATSLFEHHIRPVVLTRYCDSNGGPEQHAAGLACMKRLIGKAQLVEKPILCADDLNV